MTTNDLEAEIQSQDSAYLSQASDKQSRATSPEKSFWVSANAGSGKTYLLTRRVIRLMLEGAKPSELLCLTFTKAAAAEMAGRVFDILGEWATAESDELKAQVKELLGRQADVKTLQRARILFALSLDTPGGLRIQTIHAFCESLLHQFSLEANVPGHFEMLGDQEQKDLIAEARRRVALGALGLGPLASGGDVERQEQFASAYETVRAHASDNKLDGALRSILNARSKFQHWLDLGGEAGSPASICAAMAPAWDNYDLSPQTGHDELVEALGNTSFYDSSTLDEMIGLFAVKGGKTADGLSASFHALKNSRTGAAALELRKEIFLTKAGKPRAFFVSKSFMENNPDQARLMEEEQSLLLGQLEKIRALETLRASQALFTIAEAILIEYRNLKNRHGKLDFDDLIAKVRDLLLSSSMRDWVLYKLDYGISHILVDEAQDTSPAQWEIIEALSKDFFSGQSNQSDRTLFVVGDEKQSIYSFQGADIAEFSAQRRLFRDRVTAVDNDSDPFERLRLSFRSTPEILSAVDQVFSLAANRKGLGSETDTSHSSKRFTHRGEVLLWKPELKPKHKDPEDWLEAPQEQGRDGEEKLAARIAGTIDDWVKSGQVLDGQDRPVRYGDFLILVRKRDRFVNAMIRKLKEADIPTAGADRLKLTDHIAIEDLLMLGRFACNEIDDLALAGILKSPIFGLGEQELFDLAYGRGEQALLDRLKKTADKDSAYENCLRILLEIQQTARQVSVFDFYARLFSRHNIRQAYINRLGREVEEVLDGFFEAALDHDRTVGSGLLAFVESLLGNEPELKREVDTESDEVRVITVHSSKGLEAPIVFLVDPGSPAWSHHHIDQIAWITAKQNTISHRQIPIWIAGGSQDRLQASQNYINGKIEAAEDEYRRLLYVGMTRAADRLIVCGYVSETNLDTDNWFNMVKRALEAPCADPKFNGRLTSIDEANWRWEIENRFAQDKIVSPAIRSEEFVELTKSLPDWIGPADKEASPPKPLTPSGILDMLEVSLPKERKLNPDSGNALAIGTITHQLLQLLPEIESASRLNVIDRYFNASQFKPLVSQLDESQRAMVLQTVFALLEQPEMADLFGPGSQSEMSFAGHVKIAGQSRLIRGQIDRLAVLKDRVILADYKSGGVVPQSVDQVPFEYLAQMALYRAVIEQVFPDLIVEVRLIWTANAHIMQLPDVLLDHTLASLTNA